MDVFPQLHTARLHLRKLDADDVPALVKYANNRKISERILNIPHPYQESHAVFRLSYVWQGFKNKERFVFAIILKAEAELVGEISLHLDNAKTAQLGYWIAAPFWGKGLATEAIKAVLTFGFTRLNLDLLYASCHLDNVASIKVLTKNGFSETKTMGNIAYYALQKEQYNGD